jgi:hypothetical protein
MLSKSCPADHLWNFDNFARRQPEPLLNLPASPIIVKQCKSRLFPSFWLLVALSLKRCHLSTVVHVFLFVIMVLSQAEDRATQGCDPSVA